MSRPKHIARRKVITALLACLASPPLGAQEVKGDAPARSIAIPGFSGAAPDEIARGRDLALRIISDLRGSGKFTPLDPSKYIGAVVDPGSVPEFGGWRALNVE